MNLSVYIPDKLKDELDTYVQKKGVTKNAAIREAIEELLAHDRKRSWGDWINEIEPNSELPTVNELRDDLLPPQEISL